jgi:hypothetical protein
MKNEEKNEEKGALWRSWLSNYFTSFNVAGSIPDVIRYFNQHNLSNSTMVPGLTQRLTEMSTRNLSGDEE